MFLFFKKLSFQVIKLLFDNDAESIQILIYNKSTDKFFLKSVREIMLNEEEYFKEYLFEGYTYYIREDIIFKEIFDIFNVLKSNIEIKKIHNVDWLFINGVQTIILTEKEVEVVKKFYNL